MSIISQKLFHSIFGPVSDALALPGRHQYVDGPDRKVLLALSAAFLPRVVVEIGIQRGETASLMLAAGPWIKKYIGIDVPPGTATPLPGQLTEVPQVAGELVLGDPRFRAIVRARGTADLTPADLPIADLVFVDDDHSAPGVTRSTELARKIIRPGGICVWHDYGNKTVEVTQIIDQLNRAEGDHICLVEGTWTCFEIRRQENPKAGVAVLAPPAPPESGSGRISIGTAARPPITAAAAAPTAGASAEGIPPAVEPNKNGSPTPRRKGTGKPASAGVPGMVNPVNPVNPVPAGGAAA